MRLGLILNSFRREFIGPIPKHPGNVLIGKKRFVPPVTLRKKINYLKELSIEEEAVRYLNRSYVSKENEKKYLAMNGRSHQVFWDDFQRQPIEEPLPQFYAADFLIPLNISRSFEEED